MKKLKLLLLVLLLAPGLALAGKLVYTRDAPPIPVPAGMPVATVERLLRAAGAQREWSVQDAGPGVLNFSQVRPEYSATIAVSYDTKAVNVHYKESFGLFYTDMGDGTFKIHDHYRLWADNLVKDIKNNLTIVGSPE